MTDAFKFLIVGLFTGLGVTAAPPPFAWSVPSSSMNVVLPSGLTLPRVLIVAIGTVASLPLSPFGPLIFTVSGLAIPSVLLQLMFPSVSTLGKNVVAFSHSGAESHFEHVSTCGPVIFKVLGG